MSAVRFIFCPNGAELVTQERNFIVLPHHIAITTEQASVNGINNSVNYFDFCTTHLRSLLNEIQNSFQFDENVSFQPFSVCCVSIDKKIMQFCLELGKTNTFALLQFIYLYCLSQDRQYFANLLFYLTTGDRQFYAFIEKNFLQPWSVVQFARRFGMIPRKFNALFIAKFGLSAKTWLLTKRLSHSKILLQTTQMNILDIALECGFSNHAHFTSSFHRNFALTPKIFREQSKFS